MCEWDGLLAAERQRKSLSSWRSFHRTPNESRLHPENPGMWGQKFLSFSRDDALFFRCEKTLLVVIEKPNWAFSRLFLRFVSYWKLGVKYGVARLGSYESAAYFTEVTNDISTNISNITYSTCIVHNALKQSRGHRIELQRFLCVCFYENVGIRDRNHVGLWTACLTNDDWVNEPGTTLNLFPGMADS